MKKIFFTILLSGIGLSAIAQNDPVIMTVAGKEITKSEFLQVYLKNNNEPKYDKASLDEYMDLFKKLHGEGMTIIQVTHSEKNALYGSRVIEIEDGFIRKDRAVKNRELVEH